MIERPPAWRFVAHAIVSREGSIAARNGAMPPCLNVLEDQARFRAALQAATVTIVGREGHERHPPGERSRLVLTSRVRGIERDGDRVIHWNPEEAALSDALLPFSERGGTAVIAGGTRVMTALLSITDRFDLAVASECSIPDGRPCLEGTTSVEEIERKLGSTGLARRSTSPLGAATLHVWERDEP